MNSTQLSLPFLQSSVLPPASGIPDSVCPNGNPVSTSGVVPSVKYDRFKAYRLRHREKIKLKSREKYWKDPENGRKVARLWREKNPEKMKVMGVKQYAKITPEQREASRIRSEKWRKDSANIEKQRENLKKWKELNRERKRELNRRYKKTHLDYKIRESLRGRIWCALKETGARKHQNTMKLLGCTINELWVHLESKFTTGMTRTNYGKWHIDHIRPCASFDLFDLEHQKQCFHYTNLQPLWAEENKKKNSFYNGVLHRIKRKA